MTQISYKLDDIPEKLSEEVNKYILFSSEEECTNYFKLDKDGYGVFATYQNKNRKWFKVHRAVYVLFNKESITDQDVIMHQCDNRACCNPFHLKKGTVKENCEDMVAKGRSRTGDKNHKYKHGNRTQIADKLKKENHAIKWATEPRTRAKFNLKELREIRERLSKNDRIADIALTYNVTESTIYRLKRGKSYSHLI